MEKLYTYEINESIQANAVMKCLKNRNKPQQINEALPILGQAIRAAMPLLRPLITKVVQQLVTKVGAKLTGRQVAKMVLKHIGNGKNLLKIGKKVGQTWNQIPAELKQAIADTAINTFNQMRQNKQQVSTQQQLATQEQEELPEMEKNDIKQALTQYLDESWIDASEDGDLEELYYAVSDYLDETGDYPASAEWEDCKPWCQKHYKDIENLFLGGSL